MSRSVDRFSNRVENYAKYRPNYPREIIPYLERECGLTPEKVVADIGCGTGISCRLFLENENRVYGVEPNTAMLQAAIESLADFSDFTPVAGTAENTTLAPSSVDMAVAAQAFHWFDPERTRIEFLRILKPGGHIVLIWNERRLDENEFHVEYEKLLLKYASDYDRVRHDNVDWVKLDAFFQAEYKEAEFDNFQVFDQDGLKGRLLSASYMPSEDDDRSTAMFGELQTLFANHQQNGKIKVFYSTKVYLSRC